MNRFKVLMNALSQHKLMWISLTLLFFASYYVLLLVLTMIRFQEIPNYLVVHDVFHVYALIWQGTPSVVDAIPIFLGEPWIEMGYKNPAYYGVATWSYMLIPPKMLLVFLMGMLLSTVIVLTVHLRQTACLLSRREPGMPKQVIAAAGVGTSLISLTSATLTWVVCCATPSWSVALAMLGMSASMALWLEPAGQFLTLTGVALLIAAIVYESKLLSRITEGEPKAI